MRTPSQRWSYALSVPVDEFATADTAFVEIDLTVNDGMIGAQILPKDGRDFVGAEINVTAHGQPQKIYVPVSINDRPTLISRNDGLGASTAIIKSVRLLQKRPAPGRS